jgi:hypothetical protein
MAEQSLQKGLPPIPVNASEKPKKILEKLTFEGIDFIYFKKNRYWYLTVILIGLVFVGISLLFKEYILAVSLFVGFAVLIQLSNKKPNKFECVLGPDGLQIRNKTYPLLRLKSFWIMPEKEASTLYFHTTERLKPTIFVHIENNQSKKIYDFVSKYFPAEQESSEEVSNWITKIFKF